MKTLLQTTALALFLIGTASAQGVTKQEAVSTTKVAQKKARQLQKEASQGSPSAQKDAAKTLDAAKRAEKQARKNTK